MKTLEEELKALKLELQKQRKECKRLGLKEDVEKLEHTISYLALVIRIASYAKRDFKTYLDNMNGKALIEADRANCCNDREMRFYYIGMATVYKNLMQLITYQESGDF